MIGFTKTKDEMAQKRGYVQPFAPGRCQQHTQPGPQRWGKWPPLSPVSIHWFLSNNINCQVLSTCCVPNTLCVLCVLTNLHNNPIDLIPARKMPLFWKNLNHFLEIILLGPDLCKHLCVTYMWCWGGVLNNKNKIKVTEQFKWHLLGNCIVWLLKLKHLLLRWQISTPA